MHNDTSAPAHHYPAGYPFAALAACPSWPAFPDEPRTARQVIAWHDLDEYERNRAEFAPIEQAPGREQSEDDDTIPEADSPEDVTTRTVPLDGGTAIVEHVGDRVEVTIRLGARIVAALALSRAEASALGMAVARPDGPVLDDLFAVADAMHADASTLAHAWGTAQAV